MPRSSPPSLRRHKPSGQAVVTLNGKDCYLGHWPANLQKPPKEVQEEYDRLIAEWLANGRRLASSLGGGISINELVLAYFRHVEQHYRKPDGEPSLEVAEYKRALRPLRHLYGSTPVARFGPVALKAVRQFMVTGYTHPEYGEQGPVARGVVNQRIGRVKRCFKWGVENEVVPASVLHALQGRVGRAHSRRRNG